MALCMPAICLKPWLNEVDAVQGLGLKYKESSCVKVIIVAVRTDIKGFSPGRMTVALDPGLKAPRRNCLQCGWCS